MQLTKPTRKSCLPANGAPMIANWLNLRREQKVECQTTLGVAQHLVISSKFQTG